MLKLLLILMAIQPLVAVSASPKTITLDVKNMMCATCPIAVKKSLQRVTGVSAVKVDYSNKTAIVTYNPDKTKPDALTHATADAGFPSTLRK